MGELPCTALEGWEYGRKYLIVFFPALFEASFKRDLIFILGLKSDPGFFGLLFSATFSSRMVIYLSLTVQLKVI